MLSTPALAQVPDVGLPELPGVPEVPVEPPEVSVPAIPPVGVGLDSIPEGSADVDAAPVEYQHVAWTDGQHAAAVARDGHDLRSLWVWEHDHEEHGPGIMLRLAMDAGSRTGGAAAYIIAVDIAVEDGNATTLAWQSDDGGASWHGAGSVEDVAIRVAAGAVAPANITSTVLHIHVPLADIAAQPGVNLTGFQAWTWTQATADDDPSPVDIAPGGQYIATQEAEVPELSGTDLALSTTADPAPPYYLRGAGRHLDLAGGWEADVMELIISNPYQVAQELRIAGPLTHPARAQENMTQGDGWVALTLPAGGNVSVVYDAPQRSYPQELHWSVRSDAGGIIEAEVGLLAKPAPPSQPSSPPPAPSPPVPVQRNDPVLPPPKPPAPVEAPEPEPESDGEDSPVGVWLIGAALAVAVMVRRKE